jgi:hypothetical protein
MEKRAGVMYQSLHASRYAYVVVHFMSWQCSAVVRMITLVFSGYQFLLGRLAFSAAAMHKRRGSDEDMQSAPWHETE